MNTIIGTGALSLLFTAVLYAQDTSVSCEILDDGVEKIQCKLVTPREEAARETMFEWHSETFPQDDRERSLTLPAGHGSIYDYRYLRGRAQGAWTVTVSLTEADGTKTETSCHFQLEEGKIVSDQQ